MQIPSHRRMSFIDSDLAFDPVAGTRQVAPKPMTSESRIKLLIVNGGHRQLSGQRCASPISIFAAPLAIKVVIMVKKGDEGS